MDNVIIALATPPMKSALALIRLTGEGVFAMTDRLFDKPVSGAQSRTIFYGVLRDGSDAIDQVCLFAYPAPRTVTGEDVVEISCHGSMVIVRQIIEAYLRLGARYAEPGEFSSRAFFNGKMDLIEAESVNDMINARTKEAKNVSLLSLMGETSALVAPLKKKIADLLALIEVNIDYPEYTDIEQANAETVFSAAQDILVMLSSMIDAGEEGKIIKEGIKVAIVGEPNVGKSSLLNALLHEDKAIVSPIPGTTRDVVEGELNLRGVSFRLLDTAGIRASSDAIETQGIAKSEDAIRRSDMVILVMDAQSEFGEEERNIKDLAADKILLVVHNKEDLIAEKKPNNLYISALKNNIQPLLDAMFSALGISGESAFSTPSLNSARQLGLLKRIKQTLEQVRDDAQRGVPPDLLSVNLQSAYHDVQELLGEETTTDLTDEIFSRFCVGK